MKRKPIFIEPDQILELHRIKQFGKQWNKQQRKKLETENMWKALGIEQIKIPPKVEVVE